MLVHFQTLNHLVYLVHIYIHTLDVTSPSWAAHYRHVFILSISGKPIYSRYGKEEKLVSMFGVMQALVSIVQDDKNTLRYYCGYNVSRGRMRGVVRQCVGILLNIACVCSLGV